MLMLRDHLSFAFTVRALKLALPTIKNASCKTEMLPMLRWGKRLMTNNVREPGTALPITDP
ncbi:MAG: hypothetical protein EAZ78_25645 [Oscillatoriales cyanobacterium]|nr:MAG: hypothetical protein EAZ78_25645 [Oscillatoriales cyanobacterium]